MKCTRCEFLSADANGNSCSEGTLWNEECESFKQRRETLGDRASRDFRCNMAVEIYTSAEGTLNLTQACEQACEQAQQIFEYFNGDGE